MDEGVNWRVKQSVARVVVPVVVEYEVFPRENRPYTKPELADIHSEAAEQVFAVLDDSRRMGELRDYYMDGPCTWEAVSFPEDLNE